jgi:hypothetical protein
MLLAAMTMDFGVKRRRWASQRHFMDAIEDLMSIENAFLFGGLAIIALLVWQGVDWKPVETESSKSDRKPSGDMPKPPEIPSIIRDVRREIENLRSELASIYQLQSLIFISHYEDRIVRMIEGHERRAKDAIKKHGEDVAKWKTGK